MHYKNLLFFVFLALFLVPVASSAEEEDKIEPARYEKYDHGVIGKPGDAAERMVLGFEKNREMKPAGNIVHVESTDDYLGKGIEEIKSKVSKLEARLSETERRLGALEAKFKKG